MCEDDRSSKRVSSPPINRSLNSVCRFAPLIEWLIACIIFVVGVYVIDVISGHRREGKIYDFMKLMLASDLAESNKNKKQQ